MRNLNKRKAQTELRKVIQCLRCSQKLKEPSCVNVAGKRLELIVNEAPASFAYRVSCVKAQLLQHEFDISSIVERIEKLLAEPKKGEDLLWQSNQKVQ